MYLIPAADFTALRVIPEATVVNHLLATTHPHQVRAGDARSAKNVIVSKLDRWTRMGLRTGRGASGERLFDIGEVVNFYVRQGLLGEDDLWPVHYVNTTRRLVLESQGRPGTEAPPLPVDLPPRNFRVRFERSFDLGSVAPGTPLRLRLPRPIEDATLRKLDLRIEAPEHVKIVQEPARIEARLRASGEQQLAIAFTATFEAHAHVPQGGELSEAERELYTRPLQLFVHASEQVKARVAAMDIANATDAQAVTAIYRGLHCMTHGIVQYGDIDLSEPLAKCMVKGWYDCQMQASLFCAMCRVLGIPSRVVCGYPLYRALPLLHYWPEAWVEGKGWVPYDFFSWPLSAAGRDAGWLHVYEGALDYRMKIQVFPRLFTGMGSSRFPKWWHLTTRLEGEGIEVDYRSAPDRALIHSDRIFID